MQNEWFQHKNPRAHVDWGLTFRNAAFLNHWKLELTSYSECCVPVFTNNSCMCFSPFSSSSPERRLSWVVIRSILRKANNFRIFKLKGTWGPLFWTLILRKRTMKYRKLKTSKLQIKCSFITLFSHLLKQACTQRGQNAHNPRRLTSGTSNSRSREEICIPQWKTWASQLYSFPVAPIKSASHMA